MTKTKNTTKAGASTVICNECCLSKKSLIKLQEANKVRKYLDLSLEKKTQKGENERK